MSHRNAREPGYWMDSLDVDFYSSFEPATTFDFAEIESEKIPLKPYSEFCRFPMLSDQEKVEGYLNNC